MLIFVEIETTGFEKEDKICALGLLGFEKERCVSAFDELVNEGKKIPAIASASHHITNEMIANKPSLRESERLAFLLAHNSEENWLIVHNAAFVLGMLEEGGLKWRGKIIDTMKVTKHLIGECEIFRLDFLRYELKLYREEEKLRAQCGIKDAFVTKLLFDYLTQLVSMEEMNALSFQNVLLEKFPFGKYSGRYIEEIAMTDRGYLSWMLSLENLDDDLVYSIEYYLQG